MPGLFFDNWDTAVFLSSGHQLPISRRKRQEFNQIFNAYLGR